MWDSMVPGCVGGLLEGVRRLVDDGPCPCRTRSSRPGPPAGPDEQHDDWSTASPAATSPAPSPSQDEEEVVAAGPTLHATAESRGVPDDAALFDQIPREGDGEMPPGPWRWRRVWPTPGRPSGMALVAADGTLVLWSPGGFAPPGSPPDGRPTADVANALANLPDLAKAAAGARTLQWELDRARSVADATRRLLDRAADAVDDEIGRVRRPSDPDRPEPIDG